MATDWCQRHTEPGIGAVQVRCDDGIVRRMCEECAREMDARPVLPAPTRSDRPPEARMQDYRNTAGVSVLEGAMRVDHVAARRGTLRRDQ